jgi:magnesium transporter
MVKIILGRTKKRKFTWIDVVNPAMEELQSIAADYSLHENLLRDCLQPDHLPKIEKIGNTVFIIARHFDSDAPSGTDTIQGLTHKMAIFYAKTFLITIHRAEQDFFTSLQKQLIETHNPSLDPFRIACSILNQSLLTYEPFIDQTSSLVDDIKGKIFSGKDSSHLILKLLTAKRSAFVSIRMIHLTIEILSGMEISSVKNAPVIRDVRDTADRLFFYLVQLQDNISNLLSLQISLASLKTNEVMRVLTLFSVFFMPLTFIAGVYGMNFAFMPELKLWYGYPLALLFMALVSLVIFLLFKKKKWL